MENGRRDVSICTYNVRVYAFWGARNEDDANRARFPGHLNLDNTDQQRSGWEYKSRLLMRGLSETKLSVLGGRLTISREVVPLTIESSTRHTVLPRNSDSIGESLRRTLFCRRAWLGKMKVRWTYWFLF